MQGGTGSAAGGDGHLYGSGHCYGIAYEHVHVYMYMCMYTGIYIRIGICTGGMSICACASSWAGWQVCKAGADSAAGGDVSVHKHWHLHGSGHCYGIACMCI